MRGRRRRESLGKGGIAPTTRRVEVTGAFPVSWTCRVNARGRSRALNSVWPRSAQLMTHVES